MRYGRNRAVRNKKPETSYGIDLADHLRSLGPKKKTTVQLARQSGKTQMVRTMIEDHVRWVTTAEGVQVREPVYAPIEPLQVQTEENYNRVMQHWMHMTARALETDTRRWLDISHYVYHGIDMARSIGSERPDKAEYFDWLSCMPATITHPGSGLTARVLSDSMMVWDEGETMSHCIGKAYIPRIRRGEHIHFHMDIPESKRGVTFGYRKSEGGPGLYYMTSEGLQPYHEGEGWTFDQMRGYKNNRKYNDRPDVKEMIEYVLAIVKEKLPL